jgi:hypothetical protein
MEAAGHNQRIVQVVELPTFADFEQKRGNGGS